MTGKPTDRNNLALRAVSFNLDNLAELLEAAIKGGSHDARIVPWGNYLNIHRKARGGKGLDAPHENEEVERRLVAFS